RTRVSHKNGSTPAPAENNEAQRLALGQVWFSGFFIVVRRAPEAPRIAFRKSCSRFSCQRPRGPVAGVVFEGSPRSLLPHFHGKCSDRQASAGLPLQCTDSQVLLYVRSLALSRGNRHAMSMKIR